MKELSIRTKQSVISLWAANLEMALDRAKNIINTGYGAFRPEEIEEVWVAGKYQIKGIQNGGKV